MNIIRYILQYKFFNQVLSEMVVCVIIIICFNPSQTFTQELSEIQEFGRNPGNLELFVRLSPNKNRPLVVILHGCSQSAKKTVELSGWDKLSQELDVNLLAPQQRFSNNSGRCFNWFLKEDNSFNNGEARSIYEMINYVQSIQQIDRNQVFITGFSAGGQMAVSMLVLYPNMFEGGAVFACGPYGTAEKQSEALDAMKGKHGLSKDELVNKVIDIHPTTDKSYPRLAIYQGLKDDIVQPELANQLANQWLGLEKQSSFSIDITEQVNGIDGIHCTIYMNQLNIPFVKLYELNAFGHQLAVDPGEEVYQGGRIGVYGKDINFWSARQVAVDFGLLESYFPKRNLK